MTYLHIEKGIKENAKTLSKEVLTGVCKLFVSFLKSHLVPNINSDL